MTCQILTATNSVHKWLMPALRISVVMFGASETRSCGDQSHYLYLHYSVRILCISDIMDGKDF